MVHQHGRHSSYLTLELRRGVDSQQADEPVEIERLDQDAREPPRIFGRVALPGRRHHRYVRESVLEFTDSAEDPVAIVMPRQMNIEEHDVRSEGLHDLDRCFGHVRHPAVDAVMS